MKIELIVSRLKLKYLLHLHHHKLISNFQFVVRTKRKEIINYHVSFEIPSNLRIIGIFNHFDNDFHELLDKIYKNDFDSSELIIRNK